MKPGWIYVTTKDEHEAETIAETIISEGIASCVNIVPKMKSIYRWNGQIQRDQEAAMLIKANLEKFDVIREKIRALHSYQTPCIISIDWKNCDTDYLKWMIQT